MTRPIEIISEEVKLISKVSNDDGSVWIMGKNIFLDRQEYYEVLDQSGKLIKKGEQDTIDISVLPQGSYFLYTKTATKPFNK